MPSREFLYLTHMLETAELAVEISSKIDKQEFDKDTTLRLSLAHLVQIVGEAARRVPVEFREDFANIPWAEIVGMRSVIIHDYIKVDYDMVWKVVTQDLPSLIKELKNILAAMSKEK